VLFGIARYETDEDLGGCLRVHLLDQPGDPHLLFPATGSYEIQPDLLHGCDFSIILRIDAGSDGPDPIASVS
jgi:hypothetical protein